MPGFLKLLWFMCRVSVYAPESINNQWCDIGRVRLVKQVSQFFPAFNYMIVAINKMDGCGHINSACREHLPKKTKVMQY